MNERISNEQIETELGDSIYDSDIGLRAVLLDLRDAREEIARLKAELTDHQQDRDDQFDLATRYIEKTKVLEAENSELKKRLEPIGDILETAHDAVYAGNNEEAVQRYLDHEAALRSRIDELERAYRKTVDILIEEHGGAFQQAALAILNESGEERDD